MKSSEFRLTVELPHKLTVFGLVIGGHFPLSLLRGHTILLDRNILSLLKKMANSERADAVANRYWLDLLNDPSISLNAGLCALEGSSKRPLSLDEFFSEHDLSCSALRSLLPLANVVNYPAEVRPNVYEVQVELHLRYLAEVEFLKEAAQLIVDRPRSDRVRKLESQLLESAAKFGLKGRSLALIASLSCLYEVKDGKIPSSARQVLKPTKNYDATQAHNAISDLRSLELLASTSALAPGPVALCTADRGLAAFWCDLGVKKAVWSDSRAFGFEFDVGQRMFPRLPDSEIPRLLQALK